MDWAFISRAMNFRSMPRRKGLSAKEHKPRSSILAVKRHVFVMARSKLLSLFRRTSEKVLETNQIPVFPDFKLSGRSGFDHKV